MSSSPPQVAVSLHARWSLTPPFLEACEHLAEVNMEALWEAVQARAHEASKSGDTPWSAREVVQALKQWLPASQLPLLQLVLQVHEKSPRVEMLRSVGQQTRSLLFGDAQEGPAHFVVWVGAQQSSIHVLETASQVQAAPEKLPKPIPDLSQEMVQFLIHDIQVGVPYMSSPIEGVPTAFLYGNPEVPGFLDLHAALIQAADASTVRYVWRPDPQHPTESLPTQPLSGFGVELQIKSMEYRVWGEEAEAAPPRVQCHTPLVTRVFQHAGVPIPPSLENCSVHPDNSDLAKWSMPAVKKVGLEGAAFILRSRNPLQSLVDVSSNWPVMSHVFNVTNLGPPKLQDALTSVWGLTRSETALLINGRPLDPDTVSVFSALRTAKEEFQYGNLFAQLDFQPHLFRRLMITKLSGDVTPRVDLLKNAPENTILFVNDLSKDKQYSKWPSSIRELVKPAMPGQFPMVRKNIFTTVAILDPGRDQETAATLYNIVNQNAPIRVAMTIVSDLNTYDDYFRAPKRSLSVDEAADPDTYGLSAQSLSFQAANLFYHLDTYFGPSSALFFIHQTFSRRQLLDRMGNRAPLTIDSLKDGFEAALYTMRGHPRAKEAKSADFSTITEGMYLKRILQANDFVLSRGFTHSPVLLMNGRVLADPQPERVLLSKAVYPELQLAQELIRESRMADDSVDFYPFFLTQSATSPRYSEEVFRGTDFVSLLHPIPAITSKLAQAMVHLPRLGSRKTASSEFNVRTFLVVDPSSLSGIQAAKAVLAFLENANFPGSVGVQAMYHIQTSKPSRLALLVHGVLHGFEGPSFDHQCSQVPYAERVRLLEFLSTFAESPESAFLDLSLPELSILSSAKCLQKAVMDENLLQARFQTHMQAAKPLWDHLHDQKRDLPPSCIIVNGRIFNADTGSIRGSGRVVDAEEVEMLHTFEVQRLVKPLIPVLRKHLDTISPESREILVAQVASTAGVNQIQHRLFRRTLPNFPAQSSFSVSPRGAALPHVSATLIVDPLSQHASRLGYISQALLSAGVSMQVHLSASQIDYPLPPRLRSFYRFTGEQHGGIEPSMVDADHVYFQQLPPHHVLTMNMIVPESWLVESTRADEDLDNIILAHRPTESPRTVEAEYVLDHIVQTGQCFEVRKGPPQGLEIELRRGMEHSWEDDTLVMANYGYFQLKTNPGLLTVGLKAGPSSDVYEIQDLYYLSAFNRSGGHHKREAFLLDNFEGEDLFIQVRKQVGKESQSLLEDSQEESSSLWKSVTNFFDGNSQATETDVIHIFSLASGHLYERLLKIMMLSVVSNTKAPVKFWLLKQFLSPQFRSLVPKLAEHFGFDFEFVAYKWPVWLNKQTEKQRIMWAYKVLFLDVVFPLSLKKIIFVDADQVVRADMLELYNMDLQGATSGYTPFCDSREEMEGFRFWKQGFWKSHLRGRPYHISALYVVDLQRFRKLHAGDAYRMIYDQLSKDPNSLSNLDQDLPNFAQSHVPLFSLPQSWLWCETWCSDETKSSAKTIDLCNNPQTKERKVTMAKRVIPEWDAYDQRIREFEQGLDPVPLHIARSPTASSPSSSPSSQKGTHREEL